MTYDPEEIDALKDWVRENNLTVIYPVDALEDLEELWRDWNDMTIDQRRHSNYKSLELFGINNIAHYNMLKKAFLTKGDEDDIGGTSRFTSDNFDNSNIVLKQEENTLLSIRNEIDIIKESYKELDRLNLVSKLFTLNNMKLESTSEEILFNNLVSDINDLLDSGSIDPRNTIMDDLPFFTAQEMIDFGVHSIKSDEPEYYGHPDNRFLYDEVTTKKWFEAYKQYCEGNELSCMKEYTVKWIQKLRQLYSDFDAIKESKDMDKINARKQSILELGWNPEINFNPNNRLSVSNEMKDLIVNKFADNSIDISSFSENVHEDIDVLTEATSNDELQPVFIITTFTYTAFGKLITKFTGGKYSHAALSLDPDLSRLYSFNADQHGFSLESIERYLKTNEQAKDSIMAVYCVFVKKPDLENIKNTINKFLLTQFDTAYSFLNILTYAINKPLERPNSMICSQFVDFILKSIGVDITHKASSLVSPNDYNKIDNPKVYKIYEGFMKDYNVKKQKALIKTLQKKAKYIKESLEILNESQYIQAICENISDLNTLLYLDEKSDILNESNKIIYEKYLKPCINLVPIYETKEFPVQFDDNGNLLIKSMKKLDFESEYYQSHKLLVEYSKTSNLEGMKYELSKLWFMNVLLEKKLYKEKHEQEEIDEYNKIRAKILNDFKTYLKEVNTKEKDFNFAEYYNNSPFSDATTKINKSTLKYTAKYVKDLLAMVIK